MKVLFADSSKDLGGGERWLLDVAAGLIERGHTVWVAGRTGSPLLREAARAGAGEVAAPFAHDLDPATIRILSEFLGRERPTVMVAQIQRAHRLCALAARLGPRVPLVLR